MTTIYILFDVIVLGILFYVIFKEHKLKNENARLKISRDYWQGRSMELIDETWKLSAELKKYTEWGRSFELSGGDGEN